MNPRDFLGFLNSPAGEAFLSAFHGRRYPKGQTVSVPQDAADLVFIVRSGRLRVYLSSGHRELTLAFLQPGDVFTTHTPTFVEALEPTELSLVDTRRFAGLLVTQPGAVSAIMRVLGNMLAGTIEHVNNLAFRDARQRLTHFLVSVARRQAKDETVVRCTVTLSVTLTEVALLLGSTRQTVSTVLGHMTREGLVERIGRKELLLFDVPALAAWGLASEGGPTQATRPCTLGDAALDVR
ncbi:Crp/Fnr family transcriptional regulator [Aquabacterium sp.]|uniref:Crp/Fnr family transcriptional regulator n=1 Tax=Aquabacterium sp. TaxID=1872578 RepID=UPI0025BD724A|nr:Crp/Fnr family transcriptional regulator [Aquabacterium sp.]